MTQGAADPVAIRGLSDVDRLIIDELQKDGRASLVAIANAVGVPRSTVQAKLTRLLASGAVRVLGLADPALLGSPVVVELTVRTTSTPEPIVDRFATLPQISWIATTTAVTTILLQASFRDTRELTAFVENEIRTVHGVASLTANLAVSVFNPSTAGPAGSQTPWLGVEPVSELDPTDITIVEELRRDGRAPYARIAELVGLSIPAARQRTLRLLSTGLVQIRAMVEPTAIGLEVSGVLVLTVNGGSRAVAEHLSTLKYVNYVVQHLGEADLSLELHCPDMDSLLESRELITSRPGVTEAEFFVYDTVTLKNLVWS